MVDIKGGEHFTAFLIIPDTLLNEKSKMKNPKCHQSNSHY